MFVEMPKTGNPVENWELETIPFFVEKKELTKTGRPWSPWRPENVKKNRSTNFFQILSDLSKNVNFPETGKSYPRPLNRVIITT